MKNFKLLKSKLICFSMFTKDDNIEDGKGPCNAINHIFSTKLNEIFEFEF